LEFGLSGETEKVTSKKGKKARKEKKMGEEQARLVTTEPRYGWEFSRVQI